MVDPSDSDIAQRLDTHSAHDADALPSDVLQIFASLQDEEVQDAEIATIVAGLDASVEQEAPVEGEPPDAVEVAVDAG